mmetsp:Transcript_169578/g.538389  ORF Transcript_169578/g.538389 Transcript_169578/m.538389 type:complete len:213 (-) Transcript_169578:2136-2774(-)
MLHRPQQLPNHPPRIWIQPARRLIKHNQARAAQEGDAQAQFPLHAAAQLPGLPVRGPRALQADAREHAFDLPGDVAGGDTLELREELQVLLARQLFPEHVVLRADPQELLHLGRRPREAVAEDGARSACRREQPAEHGQRRRLAGAVVAQQCEDLSLQHDQVQRFDRVEVPEDLAEALQLDRLPAPRHRRRGLPEVLLDEHRALRRDADLSR